MLGLLVNAALARHEAIARVVHLTLTPKRSFPPQRIKIRSQHRVLGKLTEPDLDRVAQTRQFMEIYRPVGFAQYRKAEGR